ncbi:MAG: TauD/TfdA dioxygenase family protein [Acetobacteraceae bacterium]
MAISISPLHPVFVGEVAGADLTRPQTPDEARAIEAGMDRYAVLVFRGQTITDDQQKDFTRHFGALEAYASGGHIRKRVENRLGPGIADFSNLDKDGRLLSPQDRVWLFKLGDRLWHSDSSFRPIPATYSLLSARRLPSWGGNTEFADMRAAYDALDARTRAVVDDLVCLHSLMFSRQAIGFTDMTAEERESFRPVRQRLVRTHPVTGRKSLFLSSHAGAIEGWTVPEAQCFLRDLTEHATQPRFVYSHRWRMGDLVMWDNRMTMHRARPFDPAEVRDMRRTTLGGTEPTIAQTV